MDIFLPARDDLKPIRKPGTASQWLKELRSDVTRMNDAEQQLESGYQRLWNFNDLRGYEDQRVCLFQIALGAFEPQTPENLREALRVQGSTYDQNLTTEEVKRLYSNFLYEDGQSDSVRFVRESARKFILNMKHIGGSGNDDEALFSGRNNHLAIADLYIDVAGSSKHPLWQVNGFEPSNWTEYTTDSPKRDRFQQDLDRWSTQPDSFHVYLAKHGLRHCALAANKRSIFDAVWSKVLDRVILDPVSAIGFTILVQEFFVLPDTNNHLSWYRTSGLCLLGEWEGRFTLFPSHFLALLDIIHEDDVSRLRLTTDKPCGTSREEDRQRRLFEHAACVGGDFRRPLEYYDRKIATALHLASINRNNAAVDMILQANKFLSSDSASSILFTRCEAYDYPMTRAISRDSQHGSDDMLSQFHIVETLLKFERDNSIMSSTGCRPHSATEPYISKQWLLETRLLHHSYPVFHQAAKHFEQDQMSHLLGVAQPEDINIRDWMGCTVLHKVAKRGFLALTRKLVEEYDADIEAEDYDGYTPSSVAFEHGHRDLLEYFGSRGANVDFNAEYRPNKYKGFRST